MTAVNLQYADVVIMARISAIQTARQRIPFRAWLAFSLVSVNSPYWKRSRLVEKHLHQAEQCQRGHNRK